MDANNISDNSLKEIFLRNANCEDYNNEMLNFNENLTLIGDISTRSYSDLQTTSSEETELRLLLTDWKLEKLSEEFIAQNVFVNILKIIKPHHIERLLKNFDMGTQTLFEHNLEHWRNSIALPFCSQIMTTSNYRNISRATSTSTPSTSFTSMGADTPPPRFPSPYERPFSSNDECSTTIHLTTILNETCRGNMLVEYYDKFSCFKEEQRSSLIHQIGLYFDEKGIKMTLSGSHLLEQQILARFPSEKLEYYRTSNRGKIYTKYCNLQSSFKSVVGRDKKVEKSKPSNKSSSRYEKLLEPESDAESCHRALKFDNLSVEEFDKIWKACCQSILKFLKTNETAEIMEKWHFYKLPSGYRLVEMDFKAAFDGKDGFLEEWENSFEKMLSLLLVENHVKDHNVKGLLQYLKTNLTSISENGRNAAVFWAIYGYLIPTNKMVKKDMTGKKVLQNSLLRIHKNQLFFLDLLNRKLKKEFNI